MQNQYCLQKLPFFGEQSCDAWEREGGWRSGGSGVQLEESSWTLNREGTGGQRRGDRDSCENGKTQQGLEWWQCRLASSVSWCSSKQVRGVGALLFDASPTICQNLTFHGFAQKLNNKRKGEWSRLGKKKKTADMMVLLVGSLMLIVHLPFLAFSASSSSSSASGAEFEEDFVHRWKSGSLDYLW